MRKDRTEQMCRALRDTGVSYVCNTRTDKIDAEVADRLAESGCKGVFFGIESGDADILAGDHRKGVANEVVRKAVECCRASGIRTTASMIFGSINDTDTSIAASLEFSLELDSDYVLYNIYTAHPGTFGYEMAVKEGLIGEYVVDLETYHGEPAGIPTVCRSVPRARLQKWKAEAYLRYYRSKRTGAYGELIATYEEEIRALEKCG